MPVPITLAPEDVQMSAMRAITRIVSQKGRDLEERLRGAIRDLVESPEDVGVMAFCHLLADLAQHGWEIEAAGDQVQVSPPPALWAVEGGR